MEVFGNTKLLFAGMRRANSFPVVSIHLESTAGLNGLWIPCANGEAEAVRRLLMKPVCVLPYGDRKLLRWLPVRPGVGVWTR